MNLLQIHYAPYPRDNILKLANCGTKGFGLLITKDPDRVTCRRCRKHILGDSSIDYGGVEWQN